jgi:biotin operon repressor
MRAAAQRFLHAEGGFTLPAPDKMHPSEIALTLSADVLRLPYLPAFRLVLAEIVSLYAATGLCDCSDTHFASRLTISRDTANRAVQQLEDDGLILKVVDKSAGFYRTLTPVPSAISAKAQQNPYPQNAASYPQNAGRGASRKMPDAYPQNAASPSRKMPHPLAAESDTNTPFNIPVNFHQSSTTTPFGRGDAAPGPEGPLSEEVEGLAAVEVLGPEVAEPAPAPQKKVAAKKKAPDRAARPSRPDLPFAESALADFAQFEAAMAGTDYELADLRYYHEKIKNWRQKGEPPLRKDWLATSKQFFLNDVRENCLRLAPGVQRYDATSHAEPVGSGAGATGYRSSRYD